METRTTPSNFVGLYYSKNHNIYLHIHIVMSLTASYLDNLDARLEKQGGRSSLTRLLLVARKGEAGVGPDAVVQYHERVGGDGGTTCANDHVLTRQLYVVGRQKADALGAGPDTAYPLPPHPTHKNMRQQVFPPY